MIEKKSISAGKRFRRVLLSFFALLFILLIIFLLLLRTPWFQTYAAGEAAKYFSSELGTDIRIGKVHVRSFQDAEFEHVYVEDLHGDTLFFIQELFVEGLIWDKEQKLLHINKVALSGLRNRIVQYAGAEKTDLAILLARLERDSNKKKKFSLRVKHFEIREHHFSFDDLNERFTQKGIDFNHLKVHQSVLVGDSLSLVGDSLHTSLDSLVFIDRSGFEVKELSGRVDVTPRLIAADHLKLRLKDSQLYGKLSMAQESFKDMKQFEELVYIRSELEGSHLHFSDIAFFAPRIALGELGLDVDGSFRGTVNDLKGRDIIIKAGDRTYLKGDIDMVGLPDIQNTFMIVDVEEFNSDRADILSLGIPQIEQNPNITVSLPLDRLGKIGFRGNFTGFINAFTAYGDFTTDLGPLTTDMTFKRDRVSGYSVFDGKLRSSGFQVWKAMRGGNDQGLLACELDLDIQGNDLRDFKAALNGDISRLDVKGRTYSNMEVNGTLEQDVFNGNLVSNDDDLQFEFDGLADFRGEYPQVDFSAFVFHADLQQLGLGNLPEGTSLSVRISAEGLLAPDSLNGTIDMRDILYCEGEKEYNFGNALLTSKKEDGEPLIELKSTVADVRLAGNAIFREIPLVAQQALFSVFPSLDDGRIVSFRNQDISALIKFKETDAILRLFIPDLKIANESQLQFELDSKSLYLDAQFHSQAISYKQTTLSNVDCSISKTLDVIAFYGHADGSARNDTTFISDVEIRGKAYQDDIDLDIGWAGSSGKSNGNMAVLASIESAKKGTLKFLPSEMFFGRGVWEIRDTSLVYVDSTTFRFDEFNIWNADQLVRMNGVLSKDSTDQLEFEMERVAIENLSLFVKGPAWSGTLNGKGTIKDVYGQAILYTSAQIDSLVIGSDLIGDLDLQGDWNDRRKRIDMAGTVMREEIRSIDFSGWYRPEDNNAISLKLDANKFELGFINAYIPAGLSDIEGQLSGNIYVDGSLNDPLLNGQAQLAEAKIKVDVLNVTYQFNTLVDIYPDMFRADQFLVHDGNGNSGRANVSLIHKALKDFNYDVFVEVDSMMCLNTTAAQNEPFYGRVFGTGNISVSGYGKFIDVEVDARTEKGTHIIFPLGDGEEITSFDFIEFVHADSSVVTSSNVTEVLGVTMNMDVKVTPDAFVELIFDPTVGDIMSGRGVGDLSIELLPSGELSMYGGVDVLEGDYLFTLRNLINKRFTVDQGGRVSWYGDPYNAKLDLNAVYKLRAPLHDILFDPDDAFKRRIPVEVVMNLEQQILDPDISFEVRLPSVDENIRTQVSSILSTEQELNRQVFSLMVLNKFSAPASGAFESQVFAGTTGSELLSNQVSNWLSGISDDLDLGVNYRPGDAVTQRELELAVSTQLFSERLLLNTNVGLQYGDRSGAQTNSLIGDFQLEYLLTDDGKLRLEVFSQSNDKNLNQIDQANTTQGAGIGFREDFNSWSQLWRSIKGLFKK